MQVYILDVIQLIERQSHCFLFYLCDHYVIYVTGLAKAVSEPQREGLKQNI